MAGSTANDGNGDRQAGTHPTAQEALQTSQPDDCSGVYRTPQHVRSIYKQALGHYSQSRFDEAMHELEKVVQIQIDSAPIHNLLGLVHHKRGDYSRALTCLSRALRCQPHFAEAVNNMGLVLRDAGQIANALKCFFRAAEIRSDYAVPYYNAGSLLFQQGQVDQAILAYRKALARQADLSDAHNNLGIAYQQLGRHRQALLCFEEAVRHNAENASALYNLAILHQHNRELKKARACLDRAVCLNPDDSKLLIPYYQLLRDKCDWERAEPLASRIGTHTRRALESGLQPDEMPFLHLVRCNDMAENLAVARAWSNAIGQQTAAGRRFADGPVRMGSEKITLGYLSDGFRNHPNTHLICDLFKHHDRLRFNVHGYAYGENDGNPYRRRIEQGCDQFVDFQGETDASIAHRIHAYGCDILIELKGFTFGSRLGICAHRPAPIQVRYLGLPGTSGAPFFDYMITDRRVTPADYADYYSETFAYLPGCYQINSIPCQERVSSRSRSDCGLPEHGFVFCSFCGNYKMDADTFAAWMNILHRTPGSCLWLLKDTDEFTANILAAAASHGIGAERLVFAERCPRDMHLDRLGHADLALDTIAVNGMTTTSELLWAGVPVITLQGGHFISRMSASILHSVGLERLVTTSISEYEDTAVQLALHPDELNAMRAKIDRSTLRTSLYDTASMVKDLERLYSAMWRIYQSDMPPRQIDGE